MQNLGRSLYYLFVSSRPRQWLKNLAVFAAIFFGARLLIFSDFSKVSLTFLIFCLLSSGMYLVNDIVDFEADKFHFSKRNRPIAAGRLSRSLAFTFASIFILLGLLLSALLSEIIFITCLVFLTVQLFYSLILKNFIILDIMAIAFAFMIRVFAGSFVIAEPLSSWLILTVLMLSLFLAIGKRRSELTLSSYRDATSHRKTLTHYPISLLDGMVFMMATASLITYSLFTFNTEKFLTNNLLLTVLPVTLAKSKWLMTTIPFVLYGVFRYLYLIFEKKEGESPEKVLLTDLPLFLSVALWVLIVFILIYVFSF